MPVITLKKAPKDTPRQPIAIAFKDITNAQLRQLTRCWNPERTKACLAQRRRGRRRPEPERQHDGSEGRPQDDSDKTDRTGNRIRNRRVENGVPSAPQRLCGRTRTGVPTSGCSGRLTAAAEPGVVSNAARQPPLAPAESGIPPLKDAKHGLSAERLISYKLTREEPAAHSYFSQRHRDRRANINTQCLGER